MMPKSLRPSIVALLLLPVAAEAHTGAGMGFASGVFHPLSGIDHLLAMLAVGVLASRQGPQARWLFPAAFVGSMLMGAIAGVQALHVPLVEVAIAGSLIAFGIAITLKRALSGVLAATLIATFGFFHGHAHGTELAPSSDVLEYFGGFALATASLHAGGYFLGRILRARSHGTWPLRAGGAAVASVGALLLGALAI